MGPPQATFVEVPQTPEFIGPTGLINRVEYVRLIEQALYQLGYGSVADSLQRISGVQLQPVTATQLQDSVLNGDWQQALLLLPQLASTPDTLRCVQLSVLRQKYLEAIHQGDMAAALQCLRQDMGQLNVDAAQLTSLAGQLLVTSRNPDEVRQQRPALLRALQQRLPPALLLPEGRLETLVEQALTAQIAKCEFHNATQSRLSLLVDYSAGLEQIPTQATQVLTDHTDEVWHVQFSHNGQLLATSSRDCSAIIWLVSPEGRVRKLYTLLGHIGWIILVAWSPNDKLLLSCDDECVKLWDVASGACKHSLEDHDRRVLSCAWMPDSQRFLSCSKDKQVLMYNTCGQLLRTWKMNTYINDMAVAPDGTAIISIANGEAIRLFRLSGNAEAYITKPAKASSSIASTLSMTTSMDGQYLLTVSNSRVVQLWHIGPSLDALAQRKGNDGHSSRGDPASTPTPPGPVMEYKLKGTDLWRFVIRACFGGLHDNFVVSGSEDCQIHIWHRDSGGLLCKLEGHTRAVNSVSWSPTNPYLMASASDDKTVRIWMAQSAIDKASARPTV